MLSGLAHPTHRYSEAYYADYITKRPLHRQPVQRRPRDSARDGGCGNARSGQQVHPSIETSELASYYTANIGRPQLPPLSEQTQQALDQIKSIVDNELKTFNTNLRAQAEKELGRELAPDEKLGDLGMYDRMALSSETRGAELELQRIQSHAHRATNMNVESEVWIFDPAAMDMTKEELADKVIRDHVEHQIGSMRALAKETTTEEYQKFASSDDTAARSVPPLTEEAENQIRADLLAYRRAQYERGEFDVTVQVFSSYHAFNYEKVHTTLDMATGEMTVNEENRAEFRDEWEMSQSDRDFHLRNIEHFGEDYYLNKVTSIGKSRYKDAILKDIYM